MSGPTNCDNLDRLVQEGEDENALFEAVVTCLGEDIRRFAQTRCGNTRSDIEDISQDVLVAARRYLSSFRGESSLRTWLYQLVLSACSRRRRGRKNDPNLHRALEEAEPIPDPVDPEIALLVSERLTALGEAIQTLKLEDREMLAAAEWHEQSLLEVAQKYDLTVPAVKSRLFRIRRQLKERIEAKFEREKQGI
jgi:RNA polymerase sigma-70 factor, ECF subfamily